MRGGLSFLLFVLYHTSVSHQPPEYCLARVASFFSLTPLPLTRSEPALNPPGLPLTYPLPCPGTGDFTMKGGAKITMADSSLGTKFGRVPYGK